MNGLTASDVHSALGSSGWLSVLQQLGVDGQYLRNKHGPCPLCGGKDRFRFDNKGRGCFICGQCGAGDGLRLLERLHGWDFRESLRRVASAAGISPSVGGRHQPRPARAPLPVDTPASPSRRALDIRRGTCDPSSAPDVVSYLTSRSLWPLPGGCCIRAHASVDYFEGRERIGRFPALVADVRDIKGELVTIHLTYLHAGRKLEQHEPRKMLSKLDGHVGCAVQLVPPTGDVLGIGEGIESMLAAQQLHGIPTWAALTTSLLAKFERPGAVRTLVVFADRDIPGLEAAGRLMQRLQGRVQLELRIPPAPAKDWNDVLIARGAK